MNPIAELLGWSDERHQYHVFQTFNWWCELNTRTQKEHQAMICNQQLWNWYQNKFSKLELIFYDQVGSHQLNKRQMHELHRDATIQIANYYPPNRILTKIVKQGLEDVVNIINN